jgi:hypothetical protein
LHKTNGAQVWRGTVAAAATAAATTATCISFLAWTFSWLWLDFLLGLWLFLLGVLALEKGALPWLAIDLLPELFYLSRLRRSGVAFVPMIG